MNFHKATTRRKAAYCFGIGVFSQVLGFGGLAIGVYPIGAIFSVYPGSVPFYFLPAAPFSELVGLIIGVAFSVVLWTCVAWIFVSVFQSRTGWPTADK